MALRHIKIDKDARSPTPNRGREGADSSRATSGYAIVAN
jgi:hypothetical protein